MDAKIFTLLLQEDISKSFYDEALSVNPPNATTVVSFNLIKYTGVLKRRGVQTACALS